MRRKVPGRGCWNVKRKWGGVGNWRTKQPQKMYGAQKSHIGLNRRGKRKRTEEKKVSIYWFKKTKIKEKKRKKRGI